jgi:hypothetical protein
MASHKKAILTHIDILGFSDLIKESRSNAAKVDEIARTLQTIKSQMSEGGRGKQKSGKPSGNFVSLNFSDLTVRVSYVDSEESLLDSLDWELFYLATKQFELTSQGILMRGGIAVDDIYVQSDGLHSPEVQTEKIIFGPALVQAYELESKTAVFPRIAIDPDLMAKVHQAPDKITPTYIRRGDDGVHFVDYLRGTCDALGYTMDDVYSTLEQHSVIAIDKLKALNNQGNKIRQKALWLALYHNAIVDQINDGPSQNIGSNPKDVLDTPSTSLNYATLRIPDELINQAPSMRT